MLDVRFVVVAAKLVRMLRSEHHNIDVPIDDDNDDDDRFFLSSSTSPFLIYSRMQAA